MGALDFLKEFENRAIDAAAYKLLERNFQMQEDNNRLLKEKAELLQERTVELKAENDSLHTKVRELTKRLSQVAEASEFKTKDGIAFRRGTDGLFEETPYCPNCHAVMGSTIARVWICPKCEYNTRVQTLPEVLARQLNSQAETTGDLRPAP